MLKPVPCILFLLLLVVIHFSCQRATEPLINTAGPDTTSHNFTWRTWQFGDNSYPPSVINDVAVVNENDIWVVGSICDEKTATIDSTGHIIKPYNALHWNFDKWEYLKIPILSYGNYGVGEIRSVVALSRNNVWFTSTGRTIIHYDGVNFKNVLFINDTSYTSITNLLVFNNYYLYGYGTKGTLIFYNGSTFKRINTNILSFIIDMWGVKVNGNYFTYAVTTKDLDFKGDDKLLRINGLRVEDVDTEEFDFQHLRTIWFKDLNKIYVGGDKLYIRQPSKKWIVDESLKNPSRLSQIRGQDTNDIFVLGLNGFLSHYNGKDWKQFDEFWQKKMFRYADYKNDTFAAGGWQYGTRKVNVLIMKRIK